LLRFRRIGQNCLSGHLWRMFRAHMRVVWKHKAHYYRAYGLRGAANFLLITLFMASFKTRYVDRAVRFLLKVYDRKWVIKENYLEPVQCSGREVNLTIRNPLIEMEPWRP
jgi:hypothetical protein